MNVTEQIKIELRETQVPFFSDEEIEHYLEKNGNKVEAAIYEMLLIKAEDNSVTVSGWSSHDTSRYFRRLASRYREFSSGQLKE